MGTGVFYLARSRDGYRFNDTKRYASSDREAVQRYAKLGWLKEGLQVVPARREGFAR